MSDQQSAPEAPAAAPEPAPSRQRRTGFFVLYAGCLAIAGAYGLTLLLPAYVKSTGGNEADAGLVYWCGAIGAVGSLVMAGRLAQRIGPSIAAAIGSGCYAVATLAISLTAYQPVVLGAGVLLGTGWALFFTAAPIVISSWVEPEKRGFYFLVLAGFNALGMGITPVIGNRLVGSGVEYRTVFGLAAALSVASVVAFVILVRGNNRSEERRENGTATREGSVLGPIREVLTSPAWPFLLMVLLGACVFTAMNTYQTTFADSRGLDSAYFFISYTAGVIIPRFTVSKWISNGDPARTSAMLLAGMCAALIIFLFVGDNVAVYSISSALLGVTYGLVYPLIQAQAANKVSADLRHWALWYFSLAYFIGVYGFPLIGGWIIVAGSYQVLTVVLLVIAAAELLMAIWVLSGRVPAKQQAQQTQQQ
ncbi:fucose permease [Herbihabitans rhizosphaerae]|uniref:Fucose permease n=1 Tax=Herbihabitans rhizosphaerae TaxID=1872711 RepID=A0A4Q7KJ21_9PSEU|nr:MFS transporter [Herbihabitans rhizosphaerae]RZS34225.1 fucose permease [Herbihabitans rhizosphaerae]